MNNNGNKTMTKRTLSIYWRFATKYKRYMWRIYPLMVVAQIAEELFVPLLISSVITNLANNNLEALSFSNIWPVLTIILILDYAAILIWNYVIRQMWTWMEKVMVDLYMHSFDHLSKMSYSFFANRFAGSIVNQVNKFVGSFERLTEAMTWNVFKLIVATIFTIVVLTPKAPLLVVIIMVIAAIFVPVSWMFRRRQLPLNQKWAASQTTQTGQLADSISNVLAVKSFANEDLERKLMRERAVDVQHRSMDTMRMNMRQEMVTSSLSRTINMLVTVVSIVLAINGVIEAGVIYLALTYTTGILRRLWDLNNTFRTLTRVFGDAYDMTDILGIEPEVKDPAKPEKPKISDGEISFSGVDFGYPEKKGVMFLNNFDLNIQPGEKVGLVGPSGGGKTTITKLLLRFMDVDGGEIKVDGQNIANLAQKDYRRFISYVPQEPLLFHRSLTDNIRYGRLDATDKDVKKAAKMAHATDFIDELPEGYETLVGERGIKLSGGQKQRVAIARAMLSKAPILLLDEATSALDSESEKLIQDALWKLMEGRTSIVIAHRLSTIQHMDRILVLDEGEVVEQGSHSELLKQDGLYAKLWKHQSGGFIED